MEGKDDLDQLGFGGNTMPRYDLNLAGSAGVPTPDQLVKPSLWDGLIRPDYKEPDFSRPMLKGGDLAAADINFVPEFAPDPSLPNLRDAPRPSAVNMPDGMQPQAEIAQLQYPQTDRRKEEAHSSPQPATPQGSVYPEELKLSSDLVSGFSALNVRRDVREPDPSMPDLQHPELKQQSTMAPDERPGDLDPKALDVMHASAQYEQIRDKQYPAVQMDQSGMNNHHSRNFTNLMKGLEELQ